MANQRREPVGYQPFRTKPLMADGLLAVSREGGDLLRRASAAMFRMSDAAGAIADQQAESRGRREGQQAALAGRPQAEVSGGGSIGPAAGPGEPLTGNKRERAQRAKQYLIDKHGLSPVAAAGIVGNLAAESAFNPDAINRGDGRDGSDSIGIAQWNGNRARALRRFAAASGRPANDFDAQLDFIVHELSTTERRAGNQLRGARSVEEATAAFIGFERPQGWTPQNPRGGHNWRGRLAAAVSAHGDPVSGETTGAVPAAAAPQAARPTVTVSGGTFRPSGADTIYGRAYDEAGARTYVQMLETEMRSTSSQVFERFRDDPERLGQALTDLKSVLGRDHVYDEIRPDYEAGFDAMAERYMGQARENLARKVEAEDRAAFFDRTNELETQKQRALADFDPSTETAADAIAATQSALDDHYDDAVRRGVLDPDAAAKAKTASRREAALAFYGKQADKLDADGIKAMRAEMTADFKDGGIEGLDGEGWAALDTGLEKLEATKRREAARLTDDFRQRGDTMAARILAGYEVDPAELSKLMLDSGETPQGKAAMQETFAKISAGRALRDFSVRKGEAYVAGLREQYGKAPTDGQMRTLAFAEGMLAKKKTAIATDSVSYAEAQGMVPATPMLTEAASTEDMAHIMTRRVSAADEAASALETAPRYLKAGEAKALATAIRARPEAGAEIAGALVAGAGDRAADVLSEFGQDAPMVAEAGAIIAFGGSTRAAEDVILGYGKTPDGKAMKGLKPDAARESFQAATGGALAMAPDDAKRIDRAAASIARKRISEEGLDPASDEALAIHTQAVQEAAGAVFDRGQQFGGFADYGGGWLSSGTKVLVPSSIRADLFEDVLGALTDDDLKTLRNPPKAGVSYFMSTGRRDRRGLAATLGNAVPVAVPGGYAFAQGDPAGDDPQWIMGEDGGVFTLDVLALRDRLAPRVPGAFR